MIIMSKDYILLNNKDRDKLIQDANVVKFYELTNEKINPNGSESRVNKKSFIKVIK